jgi:uncharacterized membrane protein YgcG
MKVKGINVFEQHLEKLVLGFAVLVALGLVGMELLLVPEVKVGSKSVSTREVDGLLESKASQIASKLEGADGLVDKDGKPMPSEDQIELATAKFERRMSQDVAPVKQLALTAPSFNGMLVKSGLAAADVVYHVPAPPALAMVGVQETADALTPESAKDAAKASAALAARFGTDMSMPKDVVWTTPVARIDLKSIRADLAAAEPDANPPRSAIPSVWFQNTAYVLDIVFERREKQADGSWSEPAVVPVFADRPPEITFRGRIDSNENAGASFRDDVFQILGVDENQEEVLQPSFYDTVNGAFVSPEVLAEAANATSDGAPDQAAVQRRMMQLQTQLGDRRRRADAIRTELSKIGGPWDEEKERKAEEDRKREERERKKNEKGGGGTGGGGGGGPGGGGGLGGGGAMSGRGGSQTDDKEIKKQQAERRAKTAQLKRLESEIARIEGELGAAAPKEGTPAAAAPSLASKDELLVWGHDLEVEPGKTYQYRCRVRVYNPFFARKNMLVEEQQDLGLADRVALDSPVSQWSNEIRVSQSLRYFLTRATVGDGTGNLGSARFEVYRLVDGKWRVSDVSVQPGERIGRADAKNGGIDFTTDFYVIDVVEDIAGAAKSDARPAAGGVRERRGMVVIGSISEPGLRIRIPADDMADPDRMKLREQASSARASAGDSPDGAAP